MKKFLALVLVLSIVLSIPCVALVSGADWEETKTSSADERFDDATIDEALKNKRDALIQEYLSLPENEKEAFLMEEALPSLMDEVKSIPELKESLTISQQEMDQVTEFLNAVDGYVDFVP